MEYKGTKYPKECFSVVRDKTLAVSAEFTLATAQKGDSPLKVYDGFSRLVVTIINKNRKPVTANIPIEKIENIRVRSRNAQLLGMMSEFDAKPSVGKYTEENHLAEVAGSVRIANGILKGKTPLEVISEDPVNGVNSLSSQKTWLEKNLQQYPGNQSQINAIEAALSLLQNGEIENSKTPIGRVILIYKAEYRPLVRKIREDGRCPVYHITISYAEGQDYPFIVRIKNYYAPVYKNQQNLYNVQVAQAVEHLDGEMCLLEEEWNNALRAIKTTMLQYEVYSSKETITDALNADARNREEK